MGFFRRDMELRESQNIEFKEASAYLPDDLWETYSAFANTEGGDIVLGVREDRATHDFSIEGVADARAVVADFWNTLRNPQKVDRDVMLFDGVCIETLDNKDIVVIEVPRASRSEKPVRVYDKRTKTFAAWVRRGDIDSKASDEDLRRMLYDNVPDVDRKPLDRFGLDAVCKETLGRYRRVFGTNKPSSPWNNDSDEDFLYHIGAAAKGTDGALRLTQAGLLAFGYEYEITNYFPHYLLDYREETSGRDRWDDRIVSQTDEWSGNIIDFYYLVVQRLTRYFKAPFSADENGLNHGSRNPIMEAVNEAVANALVHAYYGSTQGLRVILRPDELVVSNPGTFLIDRDVAIAGGFSEARNPTLARFFSFIGITDRAGSGLQKIFKTWGGLLDGMPSISENYKLGVTELLLPLSAVPKTIPPLLVIEEIAGAGDLEERVLAVLSEAPDGLTSMQVAQVLAIAERTAQKRLKALVGHGVERTKEGRSYLYRVR